MLLTVGAFFVVAIAYVGWCDRIIGPDPDETDTDDTDGVVANARADAGGVAEEHA